MRKISLIATTALLAGGFGVAVAQVAPNNRPVNVGISPQAMQAAGNTNVYQVQIDQLKAQVAALSGQLMTTKKELAAARTDGAATASRLLTLNDQFMGHSHMYYYDANVGGGKSEVAFPMTSKPNAACKSITPTPTSQKVGNLYSPYACNK